MPTHRRCVARATECTQTCAATARLLHEVNVIRKLHPETAAIASNVAPLVAEIGNDVEALLHKLRAPIGLENGGGKVELCIAAGDQHTVLLVPYSLEIGGGDVRNDVAAASEESDAVAALKK
jgi:hypothetical protein